MNSKVAGRALAAARDNLATNVRSLESEAVLAQLEQPDAILKMYRSIDAPGYAVQVYRSDRGPALAEPSPQQYGRRYVGYWETCNLHMVANMRAVLARDPGTRLFAPLARPIVNIMSISQPDA